MKKFLTTPSARESEFKQAETANVRRNMNEWMNEVFIKNSQTAVVTIVRW